MALTVEAGCSVRDPYFGAMWRPAEEGGAGLDVWPLPVQESDFNKENRLSSAACGQSIRRCDSRRKQSAFYIMISVTCAYCGLRIMVPETVQGREGKCLNCGQDIHVPTPKGANAAATIEFRKGDRIADRYVVKEYVGKGGMGVVYRAEDLLVKEDIALKFLRPDVLKTEKGRRLFLTEAQIARRLRHENIIAVHDVGNTDAAVLYLSMEYLSGQSLRELLLRHRAEKRHIPPRLAVQVVIQVLEALHFAHRLVVHRDIKPENIMLLSNERIKVLDFGLAKAIEEDFIANAEADLEHEKRKRRVVGTLAYAAPEQIQHRTVDLRTDIYAVGLVMRELLTLRTPLEMPSDAPYKRDDVAPNVIEVLARALREAPNERWQSAAAFRDALHREFEQAYRSAQPESPGPAPSMHNTEGMVFFAGGHFLMGNNTVREEAPEEEIYVDPFWMDVHPVTVAQYAEYLKETGAPEPKYWNDPQNNGPEQPVVGVTWHEAHAYAVWAGKRLPTEAQWEFAARGQENRRYPWGNLAPDTTRCNYRNYLGMPSVTSMHEEGRTPDGLLDMAGNVLEWTSDPFLPYLQIRRRHKTIQDCPRVTVRGGCWDSPLEELTTCARKGLFANVQLKTVGFRCVMPAE